MEWTLCLRVGDDDNAIDNDGDDGDDDDYNGVSAGLGHMCPNP